MNRILVLVAMLFAGLVCASEVPSETAKAAEARRLLDDYEKGIFVVETNGVVFSNGWTMDVNGKEMPRSFFQRQADHLIAVGRPAVPILLERLDDRKRYIRYICAYSLQKITKLEPTFYYFGEPHEPFNGQTNWFKNAYETWKHWDNAQP